LKEYIEKNIAKNIGLLDYKSKRILFFANLFFSSVSGQKALKKRVCVFPYSIQ